MTISRFISFLDDQAVLADWKHPVFKRIILLEGFVFSKSQFTHALQQYSSIRDQIITILCDQGVFIKIDVFAKKNSSENVDYLEGFVKIAPMISNNGSGIEQIIHFGKMLAQHDVTIEEYVQSFIDKDRLIRNPDGSYVKHVLTRSDIKLKSFLFSTKLVEFIQNNDLYSPTIYNQG